MLKKFTLVLLLVCMVGTSVVPQKKNRVYGYEPVLKNTDKEIDDKQEIEKINYLSTTDEFFDISKKDIGNEVISERTIDSKTFRRVDGTYVLAIYNSPVHYYENNEWKNIDNSLTLDDKTGEYKNKTNDFTVKFPKEINDNDKVKLSINDYQVNWSIANIQKSEISYSENKEKSSDIRNLQNIQEQLVYENIQDGVNLEYILDSNQLKENIILSKYVENYEISFNYELKGLTIFEDKDGSIHFVNDMGIKIFSLNSLVMSDVFGKVSYDIKLEITKQSKDNYLITLVPDEEFLKTAIYPVVIDPSISSSNSDISIYDTYLRHTIFGDDNFFDSESIYCDDGEGSTAYIGYLNFKVSSNLKDYSVTYATLNVTTDNTSDGRLYLHELPSYVSVSTLDWDDRPTANEKLVDFIDITDDNTTYQLDITSSVKKWNDLGITYMPGFELKSDRAKLKFCSVEYSGKKPLIEIGYINSNGIKDYWTYNSQNISYAGTGYISDYTQDLYIVREDINFETDLQTLGVGFAYSNKIAISDDSNIGYGNGWDINYNLRAYGQGVYEDHYTVDYTGNVTYYYPIENDTRITAEQNHFYYSYIADDGTGTRMILHFYGYGYNNWNLVEMYLITSDNIKYTIEDNYLSEISSLDNNLSLIITRDSTNISHVQTITDTTGNRIELSYLNGNLNTGLLKTKDESGNYHNIEKVYYKYSSNRDNLVEVYYLTDYNQDNDLTLVYQDLSNVDKVSKYQYYSSNRLYRTYVMHVKSEDGTFSESMGEEIRYHYIGSSNKISYLESYFNSTKYSQVNYDNKPEQTKITDHAGDFVIYKFDDYGHTVNIIDNEGSSIYYDYIDIFSNSATYINGEDYNYELANQIVNQSSPQKSIFNPIENYSFENNLNGWEIYPNNGNQFLTTENEAVTGMFSLEISNQGDEWGYASQLIYLENGIYNISVDVKNTGIDNDVVYVNIQGSANPVQYVPNDGVWHRLTFNIDVGDSYSGQTIYLVSKTTGSVFFDNLIFYESYNSNRVNLLDNPSFEFGLTDNWKQNDNYYDTQYHVYSINDGSGATNDLFEEVLGELALGLNGEIYTIVERNYFENMIDSNGSVFIGGWANRYSAPQVKNANLVNGKFFRILVQQLDSSGNVIIDNNGLVIEELHYSLSYDSWQYVYEEVVIHENCDKLQVSLQYFGEGEVIFDGLSLFYHASSSSYEYDEHGRIKKVYQDDGIYTYSYIDTEEEVAIYPHQITDQDGYSIEIEQDGSKITSVSCNNVKTSPTYDPNGTGLVIGYKVYGEAETQAYFTTSTTYNHNSQYLHTTTDEFNETTTYYTNVLTGLLESIENSKYVDTNYEYYDNGLLKKVYIYNTGVYDMSYVEYIYDEYDKLVEIKMDSNYSYKIFYDSIGRIETVKVNNQTLMSYDYLVDTYETDKLTMQEYGNGDIIYFVYDDDNSNISEIKFQGSNLTPETRFTYKYDSLGRTSIYHDIINNITEQYEYDFNGNLINIRYNNGDIIEYSYDDEGNLVNISCNISNYDSSVSYDYHENIENQKLYDNTKYNLNDSTDLYKDYIYTDDEEVFDPLGRLLKIQFSRKVFEVSTNIFNISYDYEDYTSRINKISYHFEDSQEQDFEYEYLYDELGNIIQDKYVYYDSNSQSNKSVIKTYVYDNLNQIIQENSRDTSYNSSTYSSTNYTKYYHYDIRGNITGIKSMKYGETEYVNPSIPSFFLRNNGTYSASVFYNGNNDYQDIYNLNIGETPSLSFVYYDKWDTFHDFPLSAMNTTLQYSNLNTSVSGYYYSTYRATYGNYDVRFRIVYRVGNPQPTLLTPQKEVSMSYNSMWLDQLESYDVVSNGITITSEIEYDNQGNPILITNFLYDGLNRNHAALVWEGRKLVEIKIYNSSDDSILRAKICYTYNDSGIRLSKTIDDMQYNSKDKRIVYGVSNDILISEKVYSLNGSNWVEDYQIGYIYEYDGTSIGFKYYDVTGMTNYLYIKNIQGDITKIIEEDGTVVVEYFYDGYGNIVKTEGTLKNTIGKYNSFRYRSYKYDNEIGMYYLNSRYYNPEIGRFISSDGLLGEVGNIKSTNMYAYCGNNPVMYIDTQGSAYSYNDAFFTSDEDEIPYMYFAMGYITIDVGLFSSNDTFKFIKFGVGIVDLQFSTKKLFNNISEDSLLNPSLFMDMKVFSADAYLGFTCAGFKISVVSFDFGIELGNQMSAVFTIYAGYGWGIDLSNGVKLTIPGMEFSIRIDWSDFFLIMQQTNDDLI